jgi:hypothetical protein
MKTKIILSGLLAAMIFFFAANSAAAVSSADVFVQAQLIQRQILLLRIQLIQVRISQLQQQLAQLNAGSYVDIIYPNGGEKLENRHCYYIRWESKGVDKVSIGLVSSLNETVLASNVAAADGRYNWCTGNISGSNYRIRIYDPSKTNISDKSSDKFLVFDNSNGNYCSDGTAMGECSTEKPKLCFDEDMDLIDACHSCGCPSVQTCGSNSKCR